APLLAELLAPTGILGEIVGGEPDPVLRIIGGAAGFVVGALRIELRDVLVVDGLEGVGGIADLIDIEGAVDEQERGEVVIDVLRDRKSTRLNSSHVSIS